MDRIRTDIVDIVSAFTFLIGFEFEHGYKYGFGLLRLRIRIDVYRIWSELDADHVRHRCLFGYQVKAIFIQNRMSNYC